MNQIIRYFFALSLIFGIFSVHARRFSNVIIFGDSLSDVGNNTWIKVKGRSDKYSHGSPVTNLDFSTGTPVIWPQYLVHKALFTYKDIIPSSRWTGGKFANPQY